MDTPWDLTVVHTADLGPRRLREVRFLLDDAFAGDVDDTDLDHALGGLHVLAHRDGRLAGHAALVQRHLVAGDRPLRAGYVEAVAVAPGERRRGLGAALTGVVEDLAGRAHEATFLGASDEGARLYRSRGWRVWSGPTGVMTPEGVRATPDDDGGVHVHDPAGALDVTARLLCDWRCGDVW
ncbi:GNAT family N-acetyltransferase [Kineococcus esterisolvens]|uniref:GNAT family N-acetyltransferase n=1 Tax=unclassified Kineococcus TaxID=2621656 RepID=UPI003D7D2ED7